MVVGKSIDEAVEVLGNGGVVVYPTETCYGIGCDATDEEAVKKVYEAKKRDASKKLTCIVDSLETAEKFCKLSLKEKEVCENFMPGPLTFVAEKTSELPDVTNTDFAFRVSSKKVCRKLTEKLGRPIVATSANISGNDNSYSVKEMDEDLLDKVDYVLDGGKLEKNTPSTIAKITDGELKVFREGPVKKDELEEFVEGL